MLGWVIEHLLVGLGQLLGWSCLEKRAFIGGAVFGFGASEIRLCKAPWGLGRRAYLEGHGTY